MTTIININDQQQQQQEQHFVIKDCPTGVRLIIFLFTLFIMLSLTTLQLIAIVGQYYCSVMIYAIYNYLMSFLYLLDIFLDAIPWYGVHLMFSISFAILLSLYLWDLSTLLLMEYDYYDQQQQQLQPIILQVAPTTTIENSKNNNDTNKNSNTTNSGSSTLIPIPYNIIPYKDGEDCGGGKMDRHSKQP